ncbi:hypothetical protein AAL_07995 [Moelleriella libera RCEF 2490]|uniref:SRR1-like domain-containing protein n=1 Tax=Moelleriella libera RCEF 2490 TaxID=1081109 RepID=A0A167WFT8_9HYPO|nr:hypothetical protein AAL_07995 [Moelleriella libera RCEF 2490]
MAGSPPIVGGHEVQQQKQQQKQQLPQREQEWTVVRSKKGRGPRLPTRRAVAAAAAAATAATATARTGPLRSVADITDEYTRLKANFASKPIYSSIRDLAASAQSQSQCTRIVKKAVCLGIGSFDPPDGAWEAKRRAFVQLLAFETLAQSLETDGGRKIDCIFQEPLFTDADVSFLQGRGYAVLKDGACEQVDRDTLLFGIHLYKPLYAQAIANELPAVFVGTDWNTWDLLLTPVDEIEGTRVMETTYKKWLFPQDGTAFSSTCLYWRKAHDVMQEDVLTRGSGNGTLTDLATRPDDASSAPDGMRKDGRRDGTAAT